MGHPSHTKPQPHHIGSSVARLPIIIIIIRSKGFSLSVMQHIFAMHSIVVVVMLSGFWCVVIRGIILRGRDDNIEAAAAVAVCETLGAQIFWTVACTMIV